MYDIAVIGAGVVGGMIARALSAYRLSVCILEKGHDVAVGASCANSAIVHAGFDAQEGSLKARLNVRGSELMAGVCEELGVKYKNNGSLVIGFCDEDRETVETLRRRGEANGVKVPYEIVARRPGDLATCYADPAKSAEVLGWKAEKNLVDMCRDSWRWPHVLADDLEAASVRLLFRHDGQRSAQLVILVLVEEGLQRDQWRMRVAV